MLSTSDVKIIGCCGVPCAFILPPLAIINAVALAPVPEFPLIIVPGSIVSVTPSSTDVLPAKYQILSLVKVKSLLMVNGNELSTDSYSQVPSFCSAC